LFFFASLSFENVSSTTVCLPTSLQLLFATLVQLISTLSLQIFFSNLSTSKFQGLGSKRLTTMQAYHVICALESRLQREKVISGPLSPEQMQPEFIRTHLKAEDFKYETEVF
jgi:hypothetical protein